MDGYRSIIADGEAISAIAAQLPAEVVARLISEENELFYAEEDAVLVEAAAAAGAKALLMRYAAHLRWLREVGGISVAGVPVATDDRSKLMIIGARAAAQADAGWTTNWHGADGQIYEIDAAAIMAISTAVEAHVSTVFALFASTKAAIAASTITTREEVEAAMAA
jgi:hypothetical protein